MSSFETQPPIFGKVLSLLEKIFDRYLKDYETRRRKNTEIYSLPQSFTLFFAEIALFIGFTCLLRVLLRRSGARKAALLFSPLLACTLVLAYTLGEIHTD